MAEHRKIGGRKGGTGGATISYTSDHDDGGDSVERAAWAQWPRMYADGSASRFEQRLGPRWSFALKDVQDVIIRHGLCRDRREAYWVAVWAISPPAIWELRKNSGAGLQRGKSKALLSIMPEPESDDSIRDVSIFEGKDCSSEESVEWAFDNFEVRGLKPEQAPSLRAWTLLLMARSSSKNAERLFEMHVRMTERQAGGQDRYTYDGLSARDTLRRLEADMRRDSEKGAAKADAVPGPLLP